MSADDPFFGGDKGEHTILRPRPGGRRAAPAPAPSPTPAYTPPPSYSPSQAGYAPSPGYGSAPSYAPPAAAPRQSAPPPMAAMGGLPGGLNPITAAATTLLALLAQLRES